MSYIKNWWNTETEKLRGLPWQKKAGYILTYYKGWIIGLLCTALLVFYLGDAYIQKQKELVLQGFFTNDQYNLFPADYIEDAYGKAIGLKKNQQLIFDDALYVDLGGEASDYTAASNGKIMAYVTTQQLDFVVTTRAVYDHFNGSLQMMDLAEVLPADMLEQLQDQLLTAQTPDGRTIYAALDLTECRFIGGQNLSDADMALVEHDYYLFMPYNAPNVEQTADFIRFCFSAPTT